MHNNKLVEDNLHLVQIIARLQKPKYPNLDLDELIAAGNLGLVQAARDYDATVGSFSAFASPRIWGAMADMERELRWGKINKRRQVEGLDNHDRPAPRNVDHFYEAITSALDELSGNVVVWYYRDNYSHKEIAQRIGTGESWVSQLLTKSRTKIKAAYEAHELFEEL